MDFQMNIPFIIIPLRHSGPRRTTVNENVARMKAIISKYRDVRCRDINDYVTGCPPLREFENHFQIGYLPTLTYISMHRSKVVPTKEFVEGFIKAAQLNRSSYRSYIFLD